MPAAPVDRPQTGADSPVSDDDLVRAPVLGVFYRREAPDRPPLAEPGDRLAAGQPLGVIEVMKTYHQVTAPRAATLAEFLVEDGRSVEYGQPLARLER